MKFFKTAFWTAFTLGFLYCAVELIGRNSDQITVEFFNYTTPSRPKWQVLFACAFGGALLASVFFIVELIVLEAKNIRLRRLNTKLERALAVTTKTGTTNGTGVTSPTTLSGPAVTKPLLEDSDV